MRHLFIILLLSSCFPAEAQRLTGIWRGTRTQNTGGCYESYSLELHITYSNQQILGRSYSFYDQDKFTKILFSGKYNPSTKRMVIIESAVLQYNIPAHCIPCIKTYDLTWSESEGIETLQGEWKGHEMGNTNLCPPGKIVLTRQKTSLFPVEVDQSPELAALQQLSVQDNREKIVVQELVLDTTQVKIQLYDNAEIDDDTVSIYLNNTLLLHKKRLTEKPLELTLTAFPNTDYEIMMYAENLGKIPPNTSLMIITCGQKRYELRIVSTTEKTAVVRFRYEEK